MSVSTNSPPSWLRPDNSSTNWRISPPRTSNGSTTLKASKTRALNSAHQRKGRFPCWRESAPKPHRFAAGLDLERTAAAARGLYLGVVELEAGTLQSFHEVDFRAIQVKQACLVDEDLQVTELICLVQHIRLVLEGHRIAEPGTAAAHHRDAQSCRGRFLR